MELCHTRRACPVLGGVACLEDPKATLVIYDKSFYLWNLLERLGPDHLGFFTVRTVFPWRTELLPSLHACCCCSFHFWQINHDSAADPLIQKNRLQKSDRIGLTEWILCCSHISGAAEATATLREIACVSVDVWGSRWVVPPPPFSASFPTCASILSL